MTDALTDEELTELREAEAKATPGPWQYYQPSEFPKDWRITQAGKNPNEGHNHGYVGRVTRSHDPKMSSAGTKLPSEADVDLMVLARNALPKLLAEVERLRGRDSGESPRQWSKKNMYIFGEKKPEDGGTVDVSWSDGSSQFDEVLINQPRELAERLCAEYNAAVDQIYALFERAEAAEQRVKDLEAEELRLVCAYNVGLLVLVKRTKQLARIVSIDWEKGLLGLRLSTERGGAVEQWVPASAVSIAPWHSDFERAHEELEQRAARLEAALKTLVHDIDAAESYRANQGKGGQTVGMVPRLHACSGSALIYLRRLVREIDPELAKGGGA